MGVNPSDVPPWVQEYGPKVVSGLEKTAEQVAKLAGMLKSVLATAKPSATSVTIHPPWLVNPEADANDRSHADSDPMEEAYRLAWEMEQANCKAGEEPRLSKFIFADHRNISWDQLQEPYKIAWRSFVDREIFKRHVRDEAPSAR
jgi:hypothetical protein